MPDIAILYLFFGFIGILIILLLLLFITTIILICILVKSLVSLKQTRVDDDNYSDNIKYDNNIKSNKKKKKYKEEAITRPVDDITLDLLQHDFSEKPKFESNFSLNSSTIIDNNLDNAVTNLKKNV